MSMEAPGPRPPQPQTATPEPEAGDPAAPPDAAPLSSASSRDKILDVAESLFARRGFSGVGVREVADAVRLSKSSLFHHFESKSQLYQAVLARILGRIEEQLQPALASAGSPADRLSRWVEALIDALVEHPPSARLLLRGLFEEEDFGQQPSPEGEAAQRTLDGIIERLLALLREGAECGVFRPTSGPHTIQTLIGATVYHFASGDFGRSLIGGPLLSAEAVRRRKEEVRAFLQHGLAPAAPAGSSRTGG